VIKCWLLMKMQSMMMNTIEVVKMEIINTVAQSVVYINL
jgi:hypothetical protein